MLNINELNWDKVNGLMPAVVQDYQTQQILMLGYMNQAALQQTCNTGKVTFYSRSKQRLWMKGESSGNLLHLVDIRPDCDRDSLLIQANPVGPTCHLNTTSCFKTQEGQGLSFIIKLVDLIKQRYELRPESSYTSALFNEGLQRIAQKVGEEGVELALAGVAGNKDNIKNEAADLFYHVLILLCQSGVELGNVIDELRSRHELDGTKDKNRGSH